MDSLTEFVDQTERKNFAYVDYAHRFTTELYNPKQWTELFSKSGAQYIVMVSKHHEGYCNFNSKNISTTWNWNSMDVGPKRDLVGELVSAIRGTGSSGDDGTTTTSSSPVKSKQTNQPLKFGIYHSAFEWYNPLFLQDKANNFTTQDFVNLKTLQELYYLVNTYEPEIIWSDGDWMAPDNYWKSKEFLAWLATNSTVKDTVVWNDRWGKDVKCNHGSFLTCKDRYEPSTTLKQKWEKCLSMDKTSWGYNRNSTLSMYLTISEIIHNVISSISKNGNILLNIGPNSDGTISPIFEDRLLQLGNWLSINGEAVYNTTPWNVCSNDTITTTDDDGDNGDNTDSTPKVYYTRSKNKLYVHITQWPKGNYINLTCPEITSSSKAYMLGLDETNDDGVEEEDRRGGGGGVDLLNKISSDEDKVTTTDVRLRLPALTPADIPCQHAWVIVLTDIANLDEHDGVNDFLEKEETKLEGSTQSSLLRQKE